MTQPLISIVTPTLNCGKYIRQCIESVLAQNYDNFEHIIIDGKSDDQTIDIIKEYPHIKWISETDAGEVQALNKGIKRASGELICWLNADDWLDTNAFKLVIKNLSDVDYIIYGNTKFYDNNDNMFWVKESNSNVDLKYLLKWFYAGSHPHQPSMFFRREVFQNVGKFNEQLVFSVDLEFWIRAILHYRFKHINGILSHARLREDSKSWDTEKEQIESHWKVILPYHNKLDIEGLENFWFEYFCSRLYQRKAPENTKVINSEQYVVGLFKALLKSDNLETSIVDLFPEYEMVIHVNKIVTNNRAKINLPKYNDITIGFSNVTKRALGVATGRKININVIGKSEKYSSLAKINKCIKEILDSDTTLQSLDDYEINISHNYPPLRKVEGKGYWITIQPWEFGAIPKAWVTLFNEKIDEIWVPSAYVKNVYAEGGVFRNKIHVIPNGFDESIYYPLSRDNSKKFKFLFVGGMIQRKGIDILLNAFNREFISNDNVQLVIKDFGSNDTYMDNDDHKKLLNIIRANHNIKYISDKLSEHELGELYRDCDCLVHPYRGEGFGMPILEAMACGLPVIVTEGGCADEFVLDGLGYKIKSHRKSIGNVAGGRKLVGDGWLLEPDMVSLREKMRWVFQNREEGRKVGLNACDYVNSKYKWNLIGAAIKSRLAEIFKQRPVPLRIKNNVKDWKLPNVVNIGRLQEPISLYLAQKHIQAFKECLNCISKRPFHPEAHLQLIDIVLDKNDYDFARSLSDRLVSLTPNWDVAKNINKKLRGSEKIGSGIEWPELPEESSAQRLSICLITKNEEPNIGRCLESVREIADQIVVLDTGSDDNTKQIAASHGAEVYEHEWEDDFSEAKNKCLEYARGDWVLFLDADEELTSDAVETLKEDMARTNILGYRLPLENIGTPLHGCNYVPRLVRNAPGLHFIGIIHETVHASVLVIMKQWNMEQVIGKTKILHHGYKPEELQRKNKLKRNLALYVEALEQLPDEPSIMMNYAHDLNFIGKGEKAHQIYRKILVIFEEHEKEHITPEVREQFIHNYGVFLAQHLKMKELSEVMASRTARETGPVANVHYMAGLGLMNCNKFQEAIPELKSCLDKAFEDTLAPSVPDIQTWKPKHLLANCCASVGNELEAIRLWGEVIGDCVDSVDPFHDFARFLSTLDRNEEAMEVLLKGLNVKGQIQKLWELGCGIVNKDAELAEMSLEWTEEALKYHPESDVTNVRRGESLMKNGRFAEATDYFSRLSGRGEKTATAAQLVCRQLSGQGDEQDAVSARSCANEVNGWFDVLEKAPCKFDRELAEKLIQ